MFSREDAYAKLKRIASQHQACYVSSLLLAGEVRDDTNTSVLDVPFPRYWLGLIHDPIIYQYWYVPISDAGAEIIREHHRPPGSIRLEKLVDGKWK
ncbi:hypothetical protein HYX14_01160 [Candidatus Woesearchaeota archaeon]|nr:hypothetical protein [Candidatus Woesearchaeota archaeon]